MRESLGGPLFVFERYSNIGLECLSAREARDLYGLTAGVADDRRVCAALIPGEFAAGRNGALRPFRRSPG